jgi:hypothetical protein
LEFSVHPAREEPVRLAIAAGVLLVVVGALVFVWESVLFAALGAFLLVAATSPFLFETRYRLSEEGVEVEFLGQKRARPWRELRRVEPDGNGILLSPFARRSLLDGPRGVYLRVGARAPERAAVLAYVRARVKGP